MKKERPKVATTPYWLRKEGKEATQMLKGKIVHRIWRHRPKEIVIMFTDGATLFVDAEAEGLELSITQDKPRPPKKTLHRIANKHGSR
jgi:hypothetical protein